MLRRCVLILLTAANCCAIPKNSAKSELQRLARLPKVEFSKPLEFDRRFGFIAFRDPNSAALETARLLKTARNLPDEAPLYLQAARSYDRQGDRGAALASYSRAIDLFRRRAEMAPREVAALAGLGEALTALGRFAEAQAALSKAGELGTPTLDLLLARARYYKEHAWFSAAGEVHRYSSTPFLGQLISFTVEGPPPARIEEGRKYLRMAAEALDAAFKLEGGNEERLLERAAFRSFQKALELAFEQVQNEDTRPRALETSLYHPAALQDLKHAASLSDDPSVLAASALAASLAAERVEGSDRSEEAYVRQVGTRLQALADEGGENASAAEEYLGGLQLHILHDIPGARRTLRQAVTLNPARYRAWEMLVLASAQEGGEDFIEAAEARVAALPHPRSSVLLAKSYDMEGDRTRAEWVALNAVISYPNDLLANLTLAAVLLKDPDAGQYMWRIEDALNKAEKALGASRSYQNRLDFLLLKGIYLGLSDRGDQARALLAPASQSSPELQEVLRALD